MIGHSADVFGDAAQATNRCAKAIVDARPPVCGGYGFIVFMSLWPHPGGMLMGFGGESCRTGLCLEPGVREPRAGTAWLRKPGVRPCLRESNTQTTDSRAGIVVAIVTFLQSLLASNQKQFQPGLDRLQST